MKQFLQDPGESLVYEIDWVDELHGDTLVTSSWVVEAGITASDEDVDGTKATIRLAGGTAGASYVATNTVTTTGGDTLVDYIVLTIDGGSSCLWPLAAGYTFPAKWLDASEFLRRTARELASQTLERLTGYRVGVCPVTVVAQQAHDIGCGRGVPDRFNGSYAMYPVNWNGSWSNVGCCARSQCERQVPGPIGRVDSVTVDDVEVTEYEIQDDRYLVYTGTGECPFRAGEVKVTYVNAYDPGVMGYLACTLLAVEFLKALTGDNQCRLPSGTQSVSRQGVTYTIASGSFADGKTGLREVDAWIALWNPRNVDPPQVFSPDLQPFRRIG